ncbi:hypothetical protein DAT35_29450 [Vitiosangium sp. GDMCC 1.1324]|nr:hypothetical protein DAT35_29450 [Vitiosangium sp. GDMCC 1.1324]
MLSALDASVPLGPMGVRGVGLAGALVMAAILWGALARQSSDRWLRYGLAMGFLLVPAFFLPVFIPQSPDRAFVGGALSGLIGIPLGLAFPRDRSSAMALHLSIALVLLGSALLYLLALQFQAEHLESLIEGLGEWVVYGLLFFTAACLVAGHQLASRFARYEPVYKSFVVGTTGGALLTILLRSLSL